MIKVMQITVVELGFDLNPCSQAPRPKFYSGLPTLPSPHYLEAFFFPPSNSLQNHLHLLICLSEPLSGSWGPPGARVIDPFETMMRLWATYM